MEETKVSSSDSIDKYVDHVDQEISRHEKYIARIIGAVIFLAVISSVYASAIIYRQADIVADYSLAFNNIGGKLKKSEESTRKEIGSKLKKLTDELIKYHNSPEKSKTISLLDDIKGEFVGLRSYVTTLNSSAKIKSGIEIESVENIKSHINKVDFTLNNIGVEPYQRIAELQETIFDFNFDYDEIESDEVNKLISKHLKEIESLRPSSYELYMFVSLFLLCFAVLVSLYKYHHNKISIASAEKSRILQLSILLNVESDNGREHKIDQIKELLSHPSQIEGSNAEESSNAVKSLITSVSKGLKERSTST